jgi:hypothetical protein
MQLVLRRFFVPVQKFLIGGSHLTRPVSEGAVGVFTPTFQHKNEYTPEQGIVSCWRASSPAAAELPPGACLPAAGEELVWAESLADGSLILMHGGHRCYALLQAIRVDASLAAWVPVDVYEHVTGSAEERLLFWGSLIKQQNSAQGLLLLPSTQDEILLSLEVLRTFDGDFPKARQCMISMGYCDTVAST